MITLHCVAPDLDEASMRQLTTRVAIVGGGIGGLVLALQCHRRGIDCLVFEAVEKLEPLGVGINLLPHSVRILAGLGLLDELRATAIETSELAYFNTRGPAGASVAVGAGISVAGASVAGASAAATGAWVAAVPQALRSTENTMIKETNRVKRFIQSPLDLDIRVTLA